MGVCQFLIYPLPTTSTLPFLRPVESAKLPYRKEIQEIWHFVVAKFFFEIALLFIAYKKVIHEYLKLNPLWNGYFSFRPLWELYDIHSTVDWTI